MDELVVNTNEGILATTLEIADRTGNQHKNVMALIRKYQFDLGEFGPLAFETRPFETAGGVQKREIALLNEYQATLLITFMRNNEKVRAFKIQLVKTFFAMARKLQVQTSKPYSQVLREYAEEIERKERLELVTKQQAQIGYQVPMLKQRK